MSQQAVLSFIATFLPAEAWHIHRQVCGVQAFKNYVICRRRELEDRFPFPEVTQLRPPTYRWLWKQILKLSGKRPVITPSETQQLLKHRADKAAKLTHVYLGNEAMRVLPWLQREPSRKIVSFHGADLSDGFSPADFAQLDKVVQRFLCRSHSLASELRARGCPEAKIRLLRTGVPVGAYPENRSIPGNPIRLLQASRFIAKKGLDLSIRAVRSLRDRGIPATLVLAGDGPEKGALQSLSLTLDLGNAVEFPGFLDQTKLRREMEHAHLFLHPSRVTKEGDREGIPNSLLEAMATGTPVIATAHSGIPEAVTDGIEGFLTPENNVEAIVEAITRAVEPPLWKRFSLAAWERVKREFSTESSATSLENIYTELIQSP